jgi:hypothetical protein
VTVKIVVVTPCNFVGGYILEEYAASIFRFEACGFRNQLLWQRGGEYRCVVWANVKKLNPPKKAPKRGTSVWNGIVRENRTFKRASYFLDERWIAFKCRNGRNLNWQKYPLQNLCKMSVLMRSHRRSCSKCDSCDPQRNQQALSVTI